MGQPGHFIHPNSKRTGFMHHKTSIIIIVTLERGGKPTTQNSSYKLGCRSKAYVADLLILFRELQRVLFTVMALFVVVLAVSAWSWQY
jgi:hypothetical protein